MNKFGENLSTDDEDLVFDYQRKTHKVHSFAAEIEERNEVALIVWDAGSSQRNWKISAKTRLCRSWWTNIVCFRKSKYWIYIWEVEDSQSTDQITTKKDTTMADVRAIFYAVIEEYP